MFRRTTGTDPRAGRTDRPGDVSGRSSAAILAGMHLGFLGFGLIAGSVARARARQRRDGRLDDGRLVAHRGRAGERAGRGDHRSGAPTPESALDGADVVVLGAPATACLELIDRLAGPWRDRLPGRPW